MTALHDIMFRPKRMKTNVKQNSRLPLLDGRNAFLLLDTLLDAVDGVSGLDVDLNLFASEGLDLDHGASPEPEHQMQR